MIDPSGRIVNQSGAPSPTDDPAKPDQPDRGQARGHARARTRRSKSSNVPSPARSRHGRPPGRRSRTEHRDHPARQNRITCPSVWSCRWMNRGEIEHIESHRGNTREPSISWKVPLLPLTRPADRGNTFIPGGKPCGLTIDPDRHRAVECSRYGVEAAIIVAANSGACKCSRMPG